MNSSRLPPAGRDPPAARAPIPCRNRPSVITLSPPLESVASMARAPGLIGRVGGPADVPALTIN